MIMEQTRMKIEKYIVQGIANSGNHYRIKECMRRAKNGEKLTIGFLGGSITQGSLATDDKKCYAYLVYEWWKQTFPNADIIYLNAGIGATTSHYGAARAKKDCLYASPDFVIVDFSVNDDADEFFMETMEGVIRQIIKKDDTAVMLLNNVFYNTGKNAEEFHNKIAKAYGIPCISMKSSLYQMIEDGLYKRREVTPDDLHPNDLGHQLVAKIIEGFLMDCYKTMDEPENMNEYPSPVTPNAYENAHLLQAKENKAVLNGFVIDEREKAGMLDLFKDGWQASKVGDSIHFEVEGSCLAVQYLRTIKQPAPIAEVVVDGNEEQKIRLDGNFDETWGDKLCLTNVLHHGNKGMHTVDITIVEAKEPLATPFYIVALVVA